MKPGTQQYFVYIIVLKWLELKTTFIWFLKVFFGTYSLNVIQTWFVCHETWKTTLFGMCYCVKMVRIENNSHMLDITSKVAFLRFLMLFWHLCS